MASLRNAVTPLPVPNRWISPPTLGHRGSGVRLSLAGVSQRMFQALDGRHLTAAKRKWRMEVYAVVDDGETRWIQLALQGLDRHELMLSAPRTSDAKQIACALKNWLSQLLAPASVPSIVQF